MSIKKSRTHKLLRIIQIIGCLLLIISLLWYLSLYLFDKNLHVYFLDVGQGDSEYVRKMNNFDMLIDGGPNNKVMSELGEVMPFWDHKIDYVMLSHPHADHVTGLIEVLKRYKIGQVIATDAVNSTSEYVEFLNLVKEKHIPYRLVRQGDELMLDFDVKLDILWPNESFYDREVNNLNNTSIVAKLTYNNFSTLFTGDSEEEVQKDLVSNQLTNQQINQLTVLKVAHHGSANGSYEPFIKLINPKAVIISSGEGNQFGHPAKSTLEKYQKLNTQILRTDQNGRIEIISDGNKFWMK